MRLLERLAIVVVSLAIAVAVIVVLSGGPLAGRDDPGIPGPSAADRERSTAISGDAHLGPAPSRRTMTREPPTSGPHVPVAVQPRPDATISDNQLLQALALGDVVVLYGTRAPPRDLRVLASIGCGAVQPRAGRRRAGGDPRAPAWRTGLLGLAWTRLAARAHRGGPAAAQLHPVLARPGRRASRPIIE